MTTIELLKQREREAAQRKNDEAANQRAALQNAAAALGTELFIQFVPPELLAAGTCLCVTGEVVAKSNLSAQPVGTKLASGFICIPKHLPLQVKIELRPDGTAGTGYHGKPRQVCQIGVPSYDDRFCVGSSYRCYPSEYEQLQLGGLLLAADNGYQEMLAKRDKLIRPNIDSLKYSPSCAWLVQQIFDVERGRTPHRVIVEVEVPALNPDHAKLEVLVMMQKSFQIVRTAISN